MPKDRDGLAWLRRKGEASEAKSEAAKLERELRAKRDGDQKLNR
jgi:hypothetical protein